jgi:asparagine synthase (glutamine-hydrolysing)
MEFAQSLPGEERVKRFQTKIFLKRYALRYLPESVVLRRKRGLSVPIGTWLRGPLKDWAAAALTNEHLDQVGIRTAAAEELFAEHLAGRADHARALWTLIVLSEWLEWAGQETAYGSHGNPAPEAGLQFKSVQAGTPPR